MRNIEETTVITEAVIHHLLHRTGKSQLSAGQREQIERSVEELSMHGMKYNYRGRFTYFSM